MTEGSSIAIKVVRSRSNYFCRTDNATFADVFCSIAIPTTLLTMDNAPLGISPIRELWEFSTRYSKSLKPEDHWSCIAHLSAEDQGLLGKRSLQILNLSDLDQGQ